MAKHGTTSSLSRNDPHLGSRRADKRSHVIGNNIYRVILREVSPKGTCFEFRAPSLKPALKNVLDTRVQQRAVGPLDSHSCRDPRAPNRGLCASSKRNPLVARLIDKDNVAYCSGLELGPFPGTHSPTRLWESSRSILSCSGQGASPRVSARPGSGPPPAFSPAPRGRNLPWVAG